MFVTLTLTLISAKHCGLGVNSVALWHILTRYDHIAHSLGSTHTHSHRSTPLEPVATLQVGGVIWVSGSPRSSSSDIAVCALLCQTKVRKLALLLSQPRSLIATIYLVTVVRVITLVCSMHNAHGLIIEFQPFHRYIPFHRSSPVHSIVPVTEPIPA